MDEKFFKENEPKYRSFTLDISCSGSVILRNKGDCEELATKLGIAALDICRTYVKILRVHDVKNGEPVVLAVCHYLKMWTNLQVLYLLLLQLQKKLILLIDLTNTITGPAGALNLSINLGKFYHYFCCYYFYSSQLAPNPISLLPLHTTSNNTITNIHKHKTN